jgi:hypothetical protein
VKSILRKTSVLACLALFGASVYAQQEARDENFWRGHVFQRVREDLDRIQQATPRLSTDEFRLVATKHDLDELQGKMEAHRYDQPALDKTIAAVEKVANENTLSGPNRVMLQEDLRRLREFREHHEGYE